MLLSFIFPRDLCLLFPSGCIEITYVLQFGTQPCLCFPLCRKFGASWWSGWICLLRDKCTALQIQTFCPPFFIKSQHSLWSCQSFLSQSSERCFIQSFHPIPDALNLSSNSRAGTRSSPSVLGREASLFHSHSGATCALRLIFVLGSTAVRCCPTHGVTWGLFCFTAPKIL